ncbi:odorant receptor 94a-like [Bradysia coprophila]|uniref:odorant receptor 94a-like n=1 Tax=Bradysia coprophila TaxID=38358 RepID=UPI00187DC49C|nr:odorant receptor 94a-like [Bradysia coprophila]
MFTIQMDKTFKQFLKIFYQLGIWQRDEESEYRKIGKKTFYTLFGALLPVFFAINAFLCADRSEAIFSVQAAIITSVVYLKLLYILFRKQEILSFLNDPIVVHSIENRGEYLQVNKKLQKFIGFVRPYCLAIFITAVLLIVYKLPIFSNDKGLPAFISFSWNDSEIVYWLAYLLISLSIVLHSIINYTSALVWYIMLNYSLEYRLLGNKLKNLGVTTEKNQNKKQQKLTKKGRSQKSLNSAAQSKTFVENLIVLVKAHRNLTETVESFRSCFSKLFLAQITTSGIIICVAVYSLAYASKESVFQTQLFVSCLLYGLLEIFLVMYLANEITVASDRLSYCLFESNWIEQTESCKKYVLIMGEVLKQPQQLVILIYPMNLETFVKVVNGAYSMFNILKSF